ncbi:hypothetical protein GE21DRAFT_5820 [Neurospora crassa]|uniref:DNA methylation modulator-2 n=1 Tax=Neurospora crassa (strain ATCC 24698 / 74-OR23-1A / CBS 708.71 / DSM 1257 / FGSC 987) TaxID=367110 RepID=V5INX9_NEUCR|nr:DNA methylation modulator-2 [Neurospora crassa OR74A]ESA42884.1 DNA methylation modulator-2 [Neurospora crassa OR74A]KHE82757.1 hypothetical protein GE21DRAFT_5820 [Neurospora crassa]|eukprot:XP_011394295.1 DNA methylation modulator-2 [Neurospora crassa OR74A]
MEALLGASNSNPSCGSILELREQLRSVFSTKVTEKRAEHVSVTLELRSTSVFHIPVTEPENEQLEQAASIDPSLGGAQSSVAPASGEGGANGNVNGNQPTRQINAIDALINQPSDDHVLQKSVAKHIITTLGEIDGSSWAVRQVSRGEQGWTFGYICKDSWQAWSRQNAKNPGRAVIGEWSQKPDSMDAVNLSRPAFDCRGSVTVAFVKGRKVIEVKYDHTPLHKTVGQLIELLVPPPAPREPKHALQRREPKKPKEPKPPKPPKPPKQPKPPKDPNAPKPPRKKRPAGEGGAGDGTQPKKRRKKKDAAAVGPDGSILPPEMPGALPVGESSERPLYNSHAGGDTQNGYSTYPEGLVGQAPAAADEGVHVHSILNIPPAEAARRRTVAIDLLESGGIDPKTLSPEQFNIFANQAPELQQESLDMLKRYGAERLRIVHPDKEQGDGAQAAPATQAATAPSTAPINPLKKKSKKKKSGVVDSEEGVAASGGKKKKKKNKEKLTRGKCDPCRDRKIPCTKEKPSCSQCTTSGLQCHYALERKVKDISPESEAEPEAQSEPVVVEADEEPEGLGSPGFHNEPAHHEPASHEPFNQEQDSHDSIDNNMPHGLPTSGLVSPQPESATTYHQPSDLYQQFNSSVDASATPEVAHTGVTPAAMDYMHSSVTDNSLHNFSYTQPQSEPEPASAPVPEPEPIPEPVPVVEQPPPVQHTSNYAQQSSSTQAGGRTRRSLPSGPSVQSGAMNGHTTHAPTESWTPVPVPTIPAAYQNKPSPRASRARKPAPAAPQTSMQNMTQHRTQNTVQQPASQAFDDLRQASSWSSVPQPTIPAQKTSQQQARTSPYQAAAQAVRASSRQGNRSQNHTPVQQQTSAPGRHSQLQASQSHTDNSNYQSNTGVAASTSVGNYDSYSQYPTSSSRTEATNTRMNYEPYTNPSSTTSNSYSSYDTYNTRSSTKTPVASLSAAQPTASSYNTNTATATPSTSQWGSSTSVPQTRSSARSTYDTNPTTSASNQYNMTPSNPPQSSSLQGFNVRPQSMAQTRSSTAAYAQQQQQHHQQQSQAQQQQRQQVQQQPSYNSYTSQSHTTNTQQQQHQQQQQTQNWGYGSFGSTTNASSTGYGSTGASSSANNSYSTGTSASSHAHNAAPAATNAAAYSHQQPHHRSMNLSSNTYSSHIGNEDQVLYDLLRHPGA